MKQIVLLLAIAMCGCAPSWGNQAQQYREEVARRQARLQLQPGDLIDIKLGGQGMVIGYAGFHDQLIVVRTGPAGHYEKRTFAMFELEMP